MLKNNVMEILNDMVYEGITLEDVILEVLNQGCASGVVGALTYYHQTREFFISNMDEIFDLYNEYTFEVSSKYELINFLDKYSDPNTNLIIKSYEEVFSFIYYYDGSSFLCT